MENIVYLLGAGFSAPLGLPVMRNFMVRARDMHFDEPEKYAIVGKIEKTLADMARVMQHYKVSLWNIEDVLSILEMQDEVSTSSRAEEFEEYIKVVIRHYTPPMPQPDFQRIDRSLVIQPGQVWAKLWGGHVLWTAYGRFVAHLMNLECGPDQLTANSRCSYLMGHSDAQARCRYGVVTLNYDRAIENCSDQVHEHSRPSSKPYRPLPIAKLHGCVSGRIVTPTWRKLTGATDNTQWVKAYDLLRKANQLRILGYSLPDSDAYVRYLLAASAIQSKHLKRIDVICLDPDDNVRARYERLMAHQFYRFRSADIGSYLGVGQSILLPTPVTASGGNTPRAEAYDGLENHHEDFMKS